MAPVVSSGTPNLESFRRIMLNKSNSVTICKSSLISFLQKHYIDELNESAEALALLFRRVIEENTDRSVANLSESVRTVGKELSSARTKDLIVKSISQRILGIIAEIHEDERDVFQDELNPMPKDDELALPGLVSKTGTTPFSAGPPMFNLLLRPCMGAEQDVDTHPPQAHSSKNKPYRKPVAQGEWDSRISEILEGIDELLDEIRQADDQVASYALDHIHSNGIILVQDMSAAMSKFLHKAASKRTFTILQVDSAFERPINPLSVRTGQTSSRNLNSTRSNSTDFGTAVILIPEVAIFAVMARVNKVFIDTHAVLADGSSLGPSGTNLIVKAATKHSVPIVALSSVIKLCSCFPHETIGSTEGHNALKRNGRETRSTGRGLEKPRVFMDHIKPGSIDLYITNLGGHTPSSLYRIVRDHYGAEDLFE